MSERDRFFELLPFYVNGTIHANDAAWLEHEITRHPELQSQLVLMQSLRASVREQAEASLAGVPADIGFAGLSARIAAEHGVPAASAWQRLRAWLSTLGGVAGGNRLAPLASGLAFGLALGVGAMLVLPQSPPLSESRSTAPGLADGPLLRVSFRPDARESDLRLALLEARALVVAGPTRLGDYYLKTAPGRLAGARAALQASGLVLQIDEVPALPADLLE